MAIGVILIGPAVAAGAVPDTVLTHYGISNAEPLVHRLVLLRKGVVIAEDVPDLLYVTVGFHFAQPGDDAVNFHIDFPLPLIYTERVLLFAVPGVCAAGGSSFYPLAASGPIHPKVSRAIFAPLVW